MERKKRSKGRGWESCYVKKIYGTFGVEMRSYGQKLVKLCTHTHTRVSYSSIDNEFSFTRTADVNHIILHFHNFVNYVYIYIYVIIGQSINNSTLHYFIGD